MISSCFDNYLPTRILLRDGSIPDFSPFLETSEKTFLVISKSLLQSRPEIISKIPGLVEIYSEVGMNPDLHQLEQIKIPSSITQVIGIGGGSKIDAAKVIFAKVLTEGKYSVRELIQSPGLLNNVLPMRQLFNLILVPTTFGSSSEITKWGTVWDWRGEKKYSISHETLYANIALLYPELSLTAPRDVTAYTGLDTFSHALESLWNKDRNFITINYALESIRYCIETLPILLKQLTSLEYRTDMVKASTLAGLAFSQTRTAAAHALSYPLTLFHHIPHGYACSLTLGAMFEYNLAQQKELTSVLELFQNKYGTAQNSFSECFNYFLEDCEIPRKLNNFGVTSFDIPRLVKNAFHPDRFKNMSYALSAEEVKKIYETIL